jgi:hypothetical protein
MTNAFKEVKHPLNLAGSHCKVINGAMCADTGQTFGGTTGPPNFELAAICRSQHARALWHQPDTVAQVLPLLPLIEHQAPPRPAEVTSFVQANHDSLNPGVSDADGKQLAPKHCHHVDNNLCAEITQHLALTVCAGTLALCKIMGFPDGALSMEKSDTACATMTVGFLQHKRDQAAGLIEPWLTTNTFTLLQGAELCRKPEHATTCNRWIRPHFFSVQNVIRDALMATWKRVQGCHITSFFPGCWRETRHCCCGTPRRRSLFQQRRHQCCVVWMHLC